MRLWWLLTAAFLGSACTRTPPATAFTTANGLRVDLLPARGDQAAVVLLFSIGSDHDPENRSGMGHLLEHVLTTAAAAEKPARSAEEVMKRYPLGWNAQTGADYTVLATVVPSARTLDEIDDVAARMGDLRITEQDLARERPRLLSEVANMFGASGMHALGASNVASESVAPTPGGRRGGVPAEVEALSVAELEAHWKAYYKPSNARLVIAGSFDGVAVRRRIEEKFGSLPAGLPPTARTRAVVTKAAEPVVTGASPHAIALAYAAPAPGTPGYAAFLVLAARLAEAIPGHVTFAPLDRPDVLLVFDTTGRGEDATEALARLEKSVAATSALPLTRADTTRAETMFGFFLRPAPPATIGANPYFAAFGQGRRAQLGLDASQVSFSDVGAEELREAASIFAVGRAGAAAVGASR